MKQMKKSNMKNVTLATALVLLLSLPFAAFAQYDENRGLFGRGPSSGNVDYGTRDGLIGINDNTGGSPSGITNDSFGAPLGSGIAILLAAGAGYAVVRRKHSRKSTMLLLACVALLGFTQCKKDEPLEPTSEGDTTKITLNVDNGSNKGSRVNVTGADVTFTNGDKILVVSDGHYVGTLTHNGTYFNGTITDPVEGKPLYFYFLGNKDTGSLTAGTSGSTSCTVNISDQTDYPHLPVISMGVSIDRSTGETVNYASGTTSYEAQLHNKCSLMKFNVTTTSTRTICITGMNNKVTIDFGKVDESGDGLTGDTDQGFSYSVDETDGGLIKLRGGSGSPAEKWAIVLPQAALSAGADGTAYTNEETQRYKGNRPALNAISSNQYLSSGVSLNVNTADNSTNVDLSKLVYNYRANDGEILTGTLAGNYKISIAAGATVTLNGVSINDNGGWTSGDWAGISCEGDATIILSGENILRGIDDDYPGIHIKENKTLTIRGTGSLDASGNPTTNCYSAGIGGVFYKKCGNIVIEGGTITATGGNRGGAAIGGAYCEGYGYITISGGTVTATAVGEGAGIGSGFNPNSASGNITILGGTVTATSQGNGAGIGSGYSGSGSVGNIMISGGTITATSQGNGAGIGSGFSSKCGNITITNTVTRVTATRGASSPNSIGAGSSSSCGTVTIGGTVYWNGSSYQNAGNTYLPTSPLVYKPGVALANSNLGYKVCSDGKAYPVDVTQPGGVTVIGVVARKSGSSGIVLYKQDNSGKYTWENRNSGNPSAVNVYVNNLSSTTSKSWTCGERSQYEYCGAAGASWDALQTRLTNAGCEELSTTYGNLVYWTNTCPNDNDGWAFTFDSWTNYNKANTFKVRPLFEF